MKQLLSPPRLEREDIIEMEGLLCGQLEAFFPFSGHALYFPTEHAPGGSLLLTRANGGCCCPCDGRERCWACSCCTAACARGARAVARAAGRGRPLSGQPGLGAGHPHGLSPAWPRKRRCFTHGRSGRARARPSGIRPTDGHDAPLHCGCMGLVLVRLHNGPELVQREGHGFVQKALQSLAAACRTDLPSDVLAARAGRYEFAPGPAAAGSALSWLRPCCSACRTRV